MYARYIPPPKGSKAASSPKTSAQPSPPPTRGQMVPPSPTVAPAPVDGYGYARYIPGKQPVKKPVVQYFDDLPSPSQTKRKREAPEEPHGISEGGNKKAKTREDQHEMTPGRLQEEHPKPAQSQIDLKKKKNRRKRKQRTRAVDDDDDPSGSDDELSERTSPEMERKGNIAPPTIVEPSEMPGKTKHKQRSRKENIADKAHGEAQSTELANGDVGMTGVEEPVQESQTLPEKKKKKDKEEKKKKKKKLDKVVSAVEPREPEVEVLRHKTILERKEKSIKLASKPAQDQDIGPGPREEPTELHDLEPLPQPAVVADDDSKPAYDTLPLWLASPIRVSQDTRQPFSGLGIEPKPARFLEQKGFAEAFAVQTAAIPLLLPSNQHRPGDVLISAVTGSGKTLAYALPIVRDLGQGLVTRLRALVVLPTRELVKQAQEVFEICARAYDGEGRKKVRIGVAVGHQSIKAEQQSLMASESRYDPEAYEALKEQDARDSRLAAGDDPLDLGADSVERKCPRLGAWEGEVVDFSSKVDVLICTPGRLVEHVEQTPGFNLDYVRWLVVDEADKLLAQSFQGWLDLVMERFKVTRFGARDFADMEYSGVRKVVLSATLTRDLSLLNQLNLRRPRLIVLETDGTAQIAEHSLPNSLKEFAVRVHEASLKPLYLLDLLRSRDMAATLADSEPALSRQHKVSDSNSDTTSVSDSSDTSSDSSDATSDSGSSSTGDSKPSRSPLPQSLIFTKSNESAIRLARLLELLDPSLSTRISTLTSGTPTHIRRRTLRGFATASSPVRLIIASDLVARGIDIPKLSHVINYDLPPSVASYVHRVGRTARAGRSGCAWTLVGDEESGWFWGKIAKGQGVRRAQKVERTRIEAMDEERMKQYEDALAALGKEALEMKKG